MKPSKKFKKWTRLKIELPNFEQLEDTIQKFNRELDDKAIPRTWNATHLMFYFS